MVNKVYNSIVLSAGKGSNAGLNEIPTGTGARNAILCRQADLPRALSEVRRRPSLRESCCLQLFFLRFRNAVRSCSLLEGLSVLHFNRLAAACAVEYLFTRAGGFKSRYSDLFSAGAYIRMHGAAELTGSG